MTAASKDSAFRCLLLYHLWKYSITQVLQNTKYILLLKQPIELAWHPRSMSVVYRLEVLRHFAPGVFLGLEVLGHFELKEKIKKIVNIHKDFEL